ncbi:MAG: hypothetical protein E7C52_08660, partial [Streptococcus lutetiensis]|nr:hypothetical protein [Streptococcus lutetiensis]
MRKKRSLPTLILGLLVIIIFIVGIFVFVQGNQFTLKGNTRNVSTSVRQSSSAKSSSVAAKKKVANLPDVSTKDWQLALVNRDHITPEMNPDLTQARPSGRSRASCCSAGKVASSRPRWIKR